MSFTLPEYHAPQFSLPRFQSCPDARLDPAPRDGVAPEGYHATSIFPEYFKVNGQWLLAEERSLAPPPHLLCVAQPPSLEDPSPPTMEML